MRIITTNGKVDYRKMLENISCEEQRWQKLILRLNHSPELFTMAKYRLKALKRMKQICQHELHAHQHHM